jgi:hypothetical protein
MSSRANATRNHSRVRPGGGNVNDDDWVVKAYSTMMPSGKYRKKSTNPDEMRSPSPARDGSCGRLMAATPVHS